MNYSDKLQRLRDRRQGLYTKEGTYRFAEAASTLLKAEKFESLLEPKSVKYALGAMQAVESEYTQESYDEGIRVAKALLAGLSDVSVPVEFEFQGSVPLDVHVRGNSDVDLLVIHNGFVTHDADVLPAFASTYTEYHGASPLEELKTLRKESITVLNRRYWGAKIDTSKSCAVTLSEGAFTRVVDVVPSHWHDTFDWKCTKEKHTREIYVLDSHAGVRTNNKPFLHIKRIRDKCAQTSGALRKTIRLLKNLRYDSDTKIALSSYDIAAITWHMSDAELAVPYGVDLMLVEKARAHLSVVASSQMYRDLLWVPDGSRLIFDKAEKVRAVQQLSSEVDQLAKDIFKELDPTGHLFNQPYRSQVLAKSIQLGYGMTLPFSYCLQGS